MKNNIFFVLIFILNFLTVFSQTYKKGVLNINDLQITEGTSLKIGLINPSSINSDDSKISLRSIGNSIKAASYKHIIYGPLRKVAQPLPINTDINADYDIIFIVKKIKLNKKTGLYELSIRPEKTLRRIANYNSNMWVIDIESALNAKEIIIE